MAAPTLRTASGNMPTSIKFIADTAAVLMKSITRKATSKVEELIGSTTQSVEGTMEYDRQLTFSFDGMVNAWSGFATQLTGTTVAASSDVPGWPATGTCHGFAGDTGSFIFRNPESRDTNTENMVALTFEIVHLPYNGY